MVWVSGLDPGEDQGMLKRLYLSAGLGTSQFPPKGVGGSGRGKEHLDLPTQTVAPVCIPICMCIL